MIQMLINLGKWLEARFPKKVVVLEQDYQQLKKDLEIVGKNYSKLYSGLDSHFSLIDGLSIRVNTIESNAVHKEPVKLLVEEMAKLKSELASLRAGLGITASASSPEAMEAMLNGVMLGKGDQNA
jgi:hypothetical protein